MKEFDSGDHEAPRRVVLAERGVPLIFDHVRGFVGLLDHDLQPILERQPCEYTWRPGPGTWDVELHTGHAFDRSSDLRAEAWYVVLYAGTDADRVQFVFPIVGGEHHGGRLLVGPDHLLPMG